MARENYSQKWIRIQEENPGVFNCFFIYPARILVVAFVIYLTKALEASLPSYKFDSCILDNSHTSTQKWNDILHKDETTTKILQAIYTVGIDLSL